MTLDKVRELKIDRDCHVDEDWMRCYAKVIILVCKAHGIRVVSIRKGTSRSKGFHLYITITPAVDAHVANYLQWLLGDDSQRVDFNRARIEVEFNEWNKTFPVLGRRLRTIYRNARFFTSGSS